MTSKNKVCLVIIFELFTRQLEKTRCIFETLKVGVFGTLCIINFILTICIFSF